MQPQGFLDHSLQVWHLLTLLEGDPARHPSLPPQIVNLSPELLEAVSVLQQIIQAGRQSDRGRVGASNHVSDAHANGIPHREGIRVPSVLGQQLGHQICGTGVRLVVEGGDLGLRPRLMLSYLP